MCKMVRKHPTCFKTAIEVNPRNKRDPNRLVTKYHPRTSLYLHSSYYMCIRIYNNLPKYIKEQAGNKMYSALFKWLIEQNFYSLGEYFNYNKHC